MDALTLLTTRRSEKKLTVPVPNKAQLTQMFQAALHAPDHGKLHPYRFVVIENEARQALANLLKNAVVEFDLGEERLKKAEGVATKAPMIIVVIAKIDKTIKKVPAWEQMLCAGSATYALQLAANAQGFANVWVTGPWVDGSDLREAFECEENDKIIAFLMLGTAEEKTEREVKVADTTKFVSYL
ncbi:nitroreductase [Cricetibacter osteomyelitidis]|uniref:Putative NAD(P)H nitroreductase n=1 Tax=Cricetibacter osteomyelitidis TaxID=1521931 RepID=A0A4R2SSC6_9PAST|nr:NAD(P)H nitroreductase [Cricetibacter osteomyelitidis]TCP91256.1 nitroreductase [Cricetibacter osteomyelitidis]